MLIYGTIIEIEMCITSKVAFFCNLVQNSLFPCKFSSYLIIRKLSRVVRATDRYDAVGQGSSNSAWYVLRVLTFKFAWQIA